VAAYGLARSMAAYDGSFGVYQQSNVFTEQNSSISELGLKIPIQNMNVHILRSNCPPPAATHAQSLFRHSPTTFINYALVQLVPFLSNLAL